MMDGARPLRSTRRLQNLRENRPGWYRITNSAGTGPVMVSIYDEIGFLAVTADDFIRDMAAISGDVELHINSPGGDIFEGLTIYNSLRQRKGAVSVVVDGLAASAASFIAMAASPGQLAMAPHSQMMIHDGFAMAIGNAGDMRKMADLLEMQSDNIAEIYAERTGKPAAYWRDLMRKETWLKDSQAVAEGLADYVLGQEQPQNKWDLSVFLNAAPAHEPMTGTHTHPGPDGQDGREHSHDGDADHSGVWDPDHDGDDDSTPEGDTDRDYAGAPPMVTGRLRNADKYNADDRKRMAGTGHAMPDGSYPIADEEDLHNAILAVGRGGSDHDAIRRHIIKRAQALGHADAIPDNWNSDGSVKSSAGNLSDTEILAMFRRELDQLDAGRE